jgi:hypothetical protein
MKNKEPGNKAMENRKSLNLKPNPSPQPQTPKLSLSNFLTSTCRGASFSLVTTKAGFKKMAQPIFF